MKKNKFVKVAVLFCLLCLSSFFSYKTAYFIGEKYFFDKLFYKKSAAYGYTNYYDLLSPNQKNSQVIEERIKDLSNLISLANKETNQVLGSQDSELYKIAIIGDSLVFGTGVKKHNRFPEVLEKKLNKIRPTKVFVLAHPGDGLLDNFAKFVLANQYLNINLYIIGMWEDDLSAHSHYTYLKYPNINQIYQSIKALCPKEEFYYLKASDEVSWEERTIKAHYPSFSDQYANICYLEEITKRVAKHNHIFYNFSPRSNQEIPKNASEYIKKHAYVVNKFVSTVRKNGGNVIFWNNIGNYVYKGVSELESHPSRKTHQLYTNSLFKEITQNPKYGFIENPSK